jgi:hypothetical protein
MNRRDIELLSAYLDGELKPSDSAKLESRLTTDPELASALNDLRTTRTLLRKLPQRRAPRNFTLSRKMAGQNPPVQRVYPIFRFATAVATFLFFLSFAVNFMGRQVITSTSFGRGGGGGEEIQSFAAEAPMEEPAATEAPAEEPAAAMPAPTEENASGDVSSTTVPFPTLIPQGTALPPTEDSGLSNETAVAKAGETENVPAPELGNAQANALQTSETRSAPMLIPSVWQAGLAILALVGVIILSLLRFFSARQWK